MQTDVIPILLPYQLGSHMQTKFMPCIETIRNGRSECESQSDQANAPASWIVLVVLTISSCVAVAACGSSPQVQRTGQSERSGISSESLETVAFNSFADWRSFADQVAVIHVDSERAAEDPAQPPGDGRFLLRYVRVTVEKTLWAYGEPVKATELLTASWQVNGNDRRPEFPARGPRLEVGQRYVVALFRQPKPSGSSKRSLRGEWGLLTESSALPLEDDIVRIGKRATPFVETLDGLTVEELQRRLSSARPDPLAQKYRNLPLALRQRAMFKERQAAGNPGSTTRPG